MFVGISLQTWLFSSPQLPNRLELPNLRELPILLTSKLSVWPNGLSPVRLFIACRLFIFYDLGSLDGCELIGLPFNSLRTHILLG